MQNQTQFFIRETIHEVRPLHKAHALAMWEAATTGTAEATKREKEAQAALMRFWSDQSRFAKAKELHEAMASSDPTEQRQIKRIYLSAAKAQQDEATIEKITALEAEVRQLVYNFRAEVDGEALTDNQIDDILSKSKQTEEVRAAWLASKGLGSRVAGQIRELARVRNQAARAQGFRDHFQRALTLNEIDEEEMLSIYERLEASTLDPFLRLKAEINQQRADRFGITLDELMPWHFGDRFFQQVPIQEEIGDEAWFTSRDPVKLALATYDGLGLDVRDILERSDLYPRQGKDQHAFCIDIDREGDVRTLNNLQPNRRWTETLLHELGHAAYDKYIDHDLPWSLRTPPHPLSTEAVALMMGGITQDERWLAEILEVPADQASSLSQAGQAREKAMRLIFTRWCLVVTNFERALYADPDRDLDTLWWDLVERYQTLRRPPDREAPDWASKYHVGLVPVYYQNYLLGYLVTAQLQKELQKRTGSLAAQQQAGRWLVEKVFHPGAKFDWARHVQFATGEALDPAYFVDSVS